jgi:integrase
MAEKESLTDKSCDEAEGPSAGKAYVILYDHDTKGFGLRVTRARAKSFILNYRNAGGIDRRYTIGTFRDPWRVNRARKEAKRLKELIDQGHDPQGEKNAVRSAPTINDLIERWREEHAPKLRPRNRQENERLVRQWIAPELGCRKVAELRFGDLEAFHRKITTKQGTPYRANRALALLSKMLSLAVRWELRTDNPAKGVERNHEERRYRYLSPEELGRLIAALAAHPRRTASNIIRLLLLTGARAGEVLGATWDQLDLDAGVWTKPWHRTKQRREHRTPLSAPARQLLVELKATAGSSPYVFPDSRGARPLKDIRHDWAKISEAAGLEGVRIHDLRHSFASFLASSGLSLPVIGALLGHSEPSTTARYSHLLDDPLRAATERVGALVTAAGNGRTAAVVDMPQRVRHR